MYREQITFPYLANWSSTHIYSQQPLPWTVLRFHLFVSSMRSWWDNRSGYSVYIASLLVGCWCDKTIWLSDKIIMADSWWPCNRPVSWASISHFVCACLIVVSILQGTSLLQHFYVWIITFRATGNKYCIYFLSEHVKNPIICNDIFSKYTSQPMKFSSETMSVGSMGSNGSFCQRKKDWRGRRIPDNKIDDNILQHDIHLHINSLSWGNLRLKNLSPKQRHVQIYLNFIQTQNLLYTKP